jgi:hypothetical protein
MTAETAESMDRDLDLDGRDPDPAGTADEAGVVGGGGFGCGGAGGDLAASQGEHVGGGECSSIRGRVGPGACHHRASEAGGAQRQQGSEDHDRDQHY